MSKGLFAWIDFVWVGGFDGVTLICINETELGKTEINNEKVCAEHISDHTFVVFCFLFFNSKESIMTNLVGYQAIMLCNSCFGLKITHSIKICKESKEQLLKMFCFISAQTEWNFTGRRIHTFGIFLLFMSPLIIQLPL